MLGKAFSVCANGDECWAIIENPKDSLYGCWKARVVKVISSTKSIYLIVRVKLIDEELKNNTDFKNKSFYETEPNTGFYILPCNPAINSLVKMFCNK